MDWGAMSNKHIIDTKSNENQGYLQTMNAVRNVNNKHLIHVTHDLNIKPNQLT